MGASEIVTENCNGGGLAFFVWGLPEECIECVRFAGCVTVLARKCIKCTVIDQCTIGTAQREHCKGPHSQGGETC